MREIETMRQKLDEINQENFQIKSTLATENQRLTSKNETILSQLKEELEICQNKLELSDK